MDDSRRNGTGDAATLNHVFQALADPIRRDIVSRLAIGDATVGELAAPFDVSLQAVSKHISVLEQAGLVTKDKHGQRRLVHLEAEVLGLMTAWIERHQQRAEERLARLDALLAELPHDEDSATAEPRI
ncbi:MAG: winged helix-turn-helix transcriptional regulator [Microbacterium sp.]|nr:winged helix-turn-helix transcriptional regulator [Microbacterium sp.]